MSESKRKGDALEQVAKKIEEMVIRSTEGVNQAPFSVEMNVLRRINGVLHEVDMLVKVNEGSPYETVHLYECKNWEKAVGKNEVIVLAEKVKVFGAAKGVIIGRKFTENAIEQTKLTPIISLVHFTENPWSDDLKIACSGTSHRFTKKRVRILSADTFIVPTGPDWFKEPCTYKRQTMAFVEALDAEIMACIQKVVSQLENPGVFTNSIQTVVDFNPGELSVGDWNIASLDFDLEFETHVAHARLVSRFSIEKRGRFARFEFDKGVFASDNVAVEILANADHKFGHSR